MRRIADLEDPLPRRELAHIHLGGQHGQFFVIEKLEQRDSFQFLGIAGHRVSTF